MKFEQKDTGFQPVTITLETEQEVQILAAVLARIVDKTKGHLDLPYKLYCHLTDVSDYTGVYGTTVINSGIKLTDA